MQQLLYGWPVHWDFCGRCNRPSDQLSSEKQSTGEILNTVAFLFFSIFGILTLRQGFGLLLGVESAMILPLTVVVTVAFVIVCLVLYKQSKI